MPEITRDIGGVQPTVHVSQPIASTKGAEAVKLAAEAGTEVYKQSVVGGFSEEVDTLTEAVDQGTLSTSEANTRLSAKLKQTESKHPLFSRELRSLISGGAGGKKGYFPQTTEEQIQEDLLKDQAKFEQDLQQEAFKAGFTDVDAFRHHNITVARAQQAKAITDELISTGKVNSANLFDNMSANMTLYTNDISAKVLAIGKQKGGLDGNDIRQLKAATDVAFNGLQANYRDLAGPGVSIADRQGVFNLLKAEKESLYKIIDNGTLEQVLTTDLNITEAVIKQGAILSNPELATVSKFGPSAVTMYLQQLANPQLTEWINKNDPKAGLVSSGKEASKYVADSLNMIFGEGTIKDASAGQVSVADAQATKLMQDVKLPEDIKDKTGKYLAKRAADLGINALHVWDTDATQAVINKDPRVAKHLNNAYESVIADLTQSIVLPTSTTSTLSGMSQVADPAGKSVGQFSPGAVLDIGKKNWQFTSVSEHTGNAIPVKGVSSTEQTKLDLLISLAQRYPTIIRKDKSMEEWGESIVGLLKPKEDEAPEGIAEGPGTETEEETIEVFDLTEF